MALCGKFEKGGRVRVINAGRNADITGLDPKKVYTVGAVEDVPKDSQPSIGHSQLVFLDGVVYPSNVRKGFTDRDPEKKRRKMFSGFYFEKVSEN
ncbi:MAG: hypothetical protein A2599_00085 [Candidatus Staskawiczbacteria bacterium RIFOXYD1_FULL_39_28]|uniref:Uncharacterized protein n=1 Tax=Candidatus Staskawiczbacteria bacterium RIFOXYC1_FULL_38_18 TaxID=1802229 RepID=A0A1G2J8X2_9BACT|nr:MAG: hypothetical protein A2401_03570 [Candidatus Staskawiczbacteria bacterium RIFOXYC1_FULL_38_18]OGZ92218.1 MAG: hypothetical protein A2599_00085 [Candidatus Staskawiczbacteria bacterium RIFOXYD1_FULL_39_28]